MMAGENIAAPAQPDGLERLALKLAAPRATLERDFLEMGDRLVGCAQLVGEMSSAFEDMPKAFEGEDFHATNRLFKEVADLAERIVADNRSTSAFLTEISALLKDTEQAAEAIPDLVRLVRSVASVAMIVAAGLRSGDGHLATFTLNMKSSVEKIAGAIHTFTEMMGRMRDSVQQATALNTPLTERNSALLESIRVELATAFAAMEKQRSWATDQAAGHVARSARIGARIGTAVEALQVGDSTGQRIQHVEKALDLTAREKDHGSTLAVAALLSRQLGDTIETFDHEVKTLASSLFDLKGEAVDMLDDAGRSSEIILSAGGSAFGTLRRGLDRIRLMFDDYSRDSAALVAAIGDLVERVEVMLEYLDTFEAVGKEIESVSINADLKSRALGDDGRAFQKVTEELRNIARDMAPTVARVSSQLSRSGEALRRYLQTGARDSAGMQAARGAGIAAAERSIEGIAARLEDRAAFIAKTGPQAVRLLQEAEALVTRKRDHCLAWRQGAAELAALAAGHEADDGSPEPAQQLLAGIFGFYTMQAERDIHCHLFAAPPGWTAPASAAEGGASLDDIFF